MVSIWSPQPQSDLTSLAEKLRLAAEKLRQLPIDNPKAQDLLLPIIEEAKAIATQFRRQD